MFRHAFLKSASENASTHESQSYSVSPEKSKEMNLESEQPWMELRTCVCVCARTAFPPVDFEVALTLKV